MDFEKFYIKAVHFLKYRPRSEKEVRDKLLQRKAPLLLIEKIIKRLKEQKFLNDEDFAKMWVRSRTEFKPKSKRIIRLELLRKGIEKEIVDRLLTEDKETAISDIDQAKKLIASKVKRFAHLPDTEREQKLIAFLARRGFDWDTIRSIVDGEME